MKYTQPPGSDAGAPYFDGDRSAGIRGSIVPGAAVEADQRELVHLIEFSGQTPSASDLQQVRKAIEALIDAAVGSGDVSQYLLMGQARARLPIFPEIISADGRMTVSSPAAGTILVPPAVTIMHRGIFPVSSSATAEAQRTFTTAANKTYHVRWRPSSGFEMRDVANATYNPLALPETSTAFDSTYDDMIIARVVTSPANVSTITTLTNKARIEVLGQSDAITPTLFENDTGPNSLVGSSDSQRIVPINLARRPMVFLTGFSDVQVQNVSSQEAEMNVAARALSRYQVSLIYQRTVQAVGGYIAYGAIA